MRLFISYARVDKPYCVQIAETLDAHQVWYDQRLYVGQQWWKEILRRLEWCEGFVYLLSPESVSSEYCQEEFTIARNSGRKIFPVLIHDQTPIPDELRGIQYADLSHGLTPRAVKALLNAIYLSEREESQRPPEAPKPIITDVTEEEDFIPSDLTTLVAEAAEAMETQNYDQAVFLLKKAQASQHQSRFIRLDVLLQKAEHGLERQTFERRADREYRPIAELVKRPATRSEGCEAFQAFQYEFPDYDPDNLWRHCQGAYPTEYVEYVDTRFSLPLLEWCAVPEGLLLLDSHNPQKNNNGTSQSQMLHVEGFHIGKYPVTNAQFQEFIDSSDGYVQDHWWHFSEEADEWRSRNPEPRESKFQGDNRPRENVTWYEAIAFCEWLGEKTGMRITLPTDKQWRRAARGSDDRGYPWGDHFDTDLANTRESKIRKTTLVTCYDNALSPFGLYDMAGNVWEWCLNSGSKDSQNRSGEGYRAICGGSFISDYKRARTTFHFNLNPEYNYASIGFRIVALDTDI